MPAANNAPKGTRKKIEQATEVLKALGFPREQQNERSALTLLALLNLKPADKWSSAEAPLLGITPMMEFFANHYGRHYAPNTRETVRRFTVHQFLQAGLVVINPDRPSRPTNSPKAVYQIEATALTLLRHFETTRWTRKLRQYLNVVEPLTSRYARERRMQRIPVVLSPGKRILLSPGGQNLLVEKVIRDFCPLFVPGAKVVYVGDTGKKWAYFDGPLLDSLGVSVTEHGKMPDVVVYDSERNWLVLIEAVTSHGPVSAKRHTELTTLFAHATAGLVFVTAFMTRSAMVKYLGEISWETEVWIAESPTHMIHFNGERFLGPYGHNTTQIEREGTCPKK